MTAAGSAPTGKRRDSARSRELLLEAAAALFAERGYDRSTTREIGERAGVDPALIARYFGGKAQLYIAVLDLDRASDRPADLLEPGRATALLEVMARRGAGPVFRAAVTPLEDPGVQAAATAQLHWRLVDPLCERFTREGLDRPRLRAELALAAFVGVVLSRGSGAFPDLAEAGTEEIVQLVLDMFAQRPR
ncbi:TetR family transcriptional regulator [Streptacidiphilus sp. N1-3]|uniref:TetR family transcriptional regulator n=1 Tax=Streptacidiphilus alkalitolerans TaxID=3342712 RepID=A0ABV6WZV8_9ACTN